ncbi:Multidrug resistance-associated protein 5, partial [Linderina pennispora]
PASNQVPPENWPDKGKIEFVDYGMRYKGAAGRALDGISLTINPGEKLGIVGRTGAGKSSLVKALFRLVEAEQGKIVIDGVDISTLGLRELRSRLGIIPQDSALFFGSIRDNLDPLREHTIEEIWASIIKAQLVDLVNRKETKRILVLDEATANVDAKTNQIMHEVIRREFKQCTVLTIAHRLNTVMDSDRVLVMDNGRVAEANPPSQNMRFQQLVQMHDGR